MEFIKSAPGRQEDKLGSGPRVRSVETVIFFPDKNRPGF